MVTSPLHKKKMVIITSYFSGESYGLLGPQLAATVIQSHTPYECIVVGITRDNTPDQIERALSDYFGNRQPVVGFSTLSGRPDLFALAKALKENGAITILAGPQAAVDYLGETQWQRHPLRFEGFANHFSFALKGPAEQLIPYLTASNRSATPDLPGFVLRHSNDHAVQQEPQSWDDDYLTIVRWDNLYVLHDAVFKAHRVARAQVLQQIGCPYAARKTILEIDYPADLIRYKGQTIAIPVKGCSFCDVAADKGFYGALRQKAVLKQIQGLPVDGEGHKIPFELIDETPLPRLPGLLQAVHAENIKLSEVHLTLRADGLLRGQPHLISVLKMARRLHFRIILSSVGFESFDNQILRNLNKGITVDINLEAVELMRRTREAFPETFGYLRQEGGNHGFIHPTPWDNPATDQAIRHCVERHQLASDILPNHSTPLIIHHASALGRWIRAVEYNSGLTYPRQHSWIAWWDEPV